MRILFLDQSGKTGGAELSLMDVAHPYRDRCLVALFEDGPFRQRLEQVGIPVTSLASTGLKISKDNRWWQSLGRLGSLLPLIQKCSRLSLDYDLIYANTSKALVIGALASRLSGRPLVYHLRDILSPEHFSLSNLRIAVGLANRCASLVIANSQATRDAFIKAGGNPSLCEVVYNGFEPARYQVDSGCRQRLRQSLSLPADAFVVGQFSRLSPWKGQHVLIKALTDCPQPVVVLLVGAALFGEEDYVEQLHQQVAELGLGDRVHFLGFRTDIAELLSACDLVAHTSTAPEPFGRVIVEAMFAQRPIIGAAAGGVPELIQPGETGWLTSPGDAAVLAKTIGDCWGDRAGLQRVTHQAYEAAHQRFSLSYIQEQIQSLLDERFGIPPQSKVPVTSQVKMSSLS